MDVLIGLITRFARLSKVLPLMKKDPGYLE
jgi:hypothetical protein